MKSEFKENLIKECIKYGIYLDENKLDKFEKYKNLLIEWNEKINLTAITDEYQIILKHFIDCLEIVKHIEEGSNIIDVGTGAGFPGIVIAIYFEKNVKITLLDSLNKRINFLENVVKDLNLKNVELVHGRAEELAQNQNYREKYDLVVSRAVASLRVLLEYDIPFLKVNGKGLFMKGDNFKEEINDSKNALKLLNSSIDNKFEYKYEVEEETYNRVILEVIKENITSKKYPRMYSQIKKSPL